VSEARTSVAGQDVNGLASGGITGITVGGFKSIATTQSIEVRPLTILSGANSSGKTSFLQPLLLLKQTLEATYDPGPLLLYGPNVKFTSGEQLLSRVPRQAPADGFEVGIRVGRDHDVKVFLGHEQRKGFHVERTTYKLLGGPLELRPGMSAAQLKKQHPGPVPAGGGDLEPRVVRDRCFLVRKYGHSEGDQPSVPHPEQLSWFLPHIEGLIHVPGLRGNPERVYPVTGVGPRFPGTFEKYVASVIARWQSEGDGASLTDLNRQMANIGLASRVAAMPISEAQVELRVPRLLRSERDESDDLVNIADVGLGVSQTLPVLVALLAAKPGQAVYIEQPEIHLHPRAQVRLADVLAEAAKRGVRVIAETHSSLLLQAVQTLVAKGELDPDLVKLHWFVRNEADGSTEVRSANLDEEGAYGDWPTDFDDVELNSAKEYLDAAEARSRA